MADNLISLQVNPGVPVTEGAEAKTNLLLAPTLNSDRLRHFSEDIYDRSAESHLSRFVKVLIGDAGAGQVRKRLFLARLQSTLQGSHFYDLDRFYGPLFGVRRSEDELLDFDPQVGVGTTEQWDEAAARDSSFRSRIEQFAKGLSYGPTPTGMELIAEALLSVDCDVYESFIQADGSYQTYQELENLYGPGSPGGTYNGMEGVSYSALEGSELNRISGNERRIFTIRPKRRISQREAFDLRRVVNRIKPADSRLVIDFVGVPLHSPLVIDSATADSQHWEIVSAVAGNSSINSPYQIVSAEPVEQPRPPFSGYQGEAWSYNADMVGVIAYSEDLGSLPTPLPPQRVTYADASTRDFSPDQAILPRRVVQAGRVISDGVLVSHPYAGVQGLTPLYQDSYLIPRHDDAISRLYADGIPLEELNTLLSQQEGLDPFQQNPEGRYWVSGQRFLNDGFDEILEVRLSADRLINYLSFEVSHFPHRLVAEVFSSDSEWVEVYRHSISDSIPKIVPEGVDVSQRSGHPEHSSPNHWFHVGVRINRLTGSRVRLKMNRSVQDSTAPQIKVRDPQGARALREVPYTLALRDLDFGYRVSSRDDFDFLPASANGLISITRDVTGSLVEFRAKELLAGNLLTPGGFWRSEPQPVNYAVVNLYLDTRGPGNGDGNVIDRFFTDPTHAGPHFTIYYSNDPQITDGTEEFYEQRQWTPIARDYTLQKGYVHLPATRARYWKFEFTDLTAEPYESFIPIDRVVKLFPRARVEAMNRNYEKTAVQVPDDLLPSIDSVRQSRYNDALNVFGARGDSGQRSLVYQATEALYFPDLTRQARIANDSWVFGFTPWHQSGKAPRFSVKGRHVYETVEVRHASKVGFFVGLREIKAYRTSWEADDDTQVYLDTFDDFRNLTAGFTWTFEPGYMRTASTPQPTVEATSRTFASLHNVKGLQFATVQSSANQLVADHNFRDPALATYTFDDIERSLRIGDAQLIYSPNDNSLIMVRHVTPVPRPLVNTTGLVQPLPVTGFSYRNFSVLDEGAAAATEGGFATSPVGLSPEGRIYAAVRFTALTDLTSPVFLQLVNSVNNAVLAEKPITAEKGQTVEDYVAFDIVTVESVVRARLVQRGKSDDAVKVSSLAIFEDGIIWEFSVNGGGDWIPAQSIRNNDNAVLTFPNVGNQLRYRTRATRVNQWVSAIKIRPWYVGAKNSRTTGNHRGPNLSVYDQDVPINEDPLFTTWHKPIPPWWFQSSRKFPVLAVEGAPNVTEFARFYGRPSSDTVAEPTDVAVQHIIYVRQAEDRLDILSPVTDDVTRSLMLVRNPSDSAAPTDEAIGTPVYGISKPIMGTIVRPVFSETR